MKSTKTLLLLLSFCFFGSMLINTISAQRTTRVSAVSVDSKIVKPLDVQTLKLRTNATKVLNRWIDARHMELLKSGNFVPMQNPAANTGGNLPGGFPTSFADGTNCAKIECPDVFGDDVTCWECH